MTTTVHTFTLPFIPVSLNALLRLHWAKRNRTKQADMTAIACFANTIPKATGKRRIEWTVTQRHRPQGGGNALDPDAIAKVLLDGLVKCGRLVDDSAKWCELGTPRVVRGERDSVQVVLTEMGE